MGCDAATSRINGAKSHGPNTQRGKAIASKNATKHGLLAQQQPLLVTEDLSTFEGIVQGLVDHYQPNSPIEHFLVQQIAMGMVKQHRLWGVEAAIANIEILQAQKQQQFPDHVIPAMVIDSSFCVEEERIPCKALFCREQRCLTDLVDDLHSLLAQADEVTNTEWLEVIQGTIATGNYQGDRSARVWQVQAMVVSWLESKWDGSPFTVEMAKHHAQNLLQQAQNRLEELEVAIAQLDGLEAEIQATEATAKGIQQPELFSRYQREINRTLYGAIAQLESIQQQRSNRQQ